MKKSKLLWRAAIILILGAYYCLLDARGPTQDVYEYHAANATSNIISFGHDYETGEDLLNITYTVRNVTHSDPDAEGEHHDVKFVRKNDEDLDRMINTTNDGYFSADELGDFGSMYRIKGVVVGNVCYYSSHKVTFIKTFYHTIYYQDGDRVVANHYLRLWIYILSWMLVAFLVLCVKLSGEAGD